MIKGSVTPDSKKSIQINQSWESWLFSYAVSYLFVWTGLEIWNNCIKTCDH